MALVNISIDDVSPHPQSSIEVVDQCYRVLDVFPDAKFTLFVPTAYWRTIGTGATQNCFSLIYHEEFCEQLRSLPASNFEIGYHGCFHGIPGISNNDEFWKDEEGNVLEYITACNIVRSMKEIVIKMGLQDVFKPMIRPPAWRMAPDAFQACVDEGIKLFALSPDQYALDVYQGMEKNVDHVMYTCCPPSYKPLKLSEKTEIVYHACEWDPGFLSTAATDNLIDFLRSSNEIEFCFIDRLK